MVKNLSRRFGPQSSMAPEPGGKKPPVFIECGGCGHYHPEGFDGDCRDDNNRFTFDQLDDKYGTGGDSGPNWVEITLEEQMEQEEEEEEEDEREIATYKGHVIRLAKPSGGKAGKGHNKTSTVQVVKEGPSGSVILKSFRFNMNDNESAKKAARKAREYVDQLPG